MQVQRHLFPLEMSSFEMSSADKIYILTKLRHKTLYADPTTLFNIHSLVQLTDGLTVFTTEQNQKSGQQSRVVFKLTYGS